MYERLRRVRISQAAEGMVCPRPVCCSPVYLEISPIVVSSIRPVHNLASLSYHAFRLPPVATTWL